ncbi:hypothetical protein [Hoeflea prorocentri]|uniref:Phytol kinase n=1 Tax=Hoeflea prorocentri TaxID=1922333 RepID=A0A9X3UM90_9HYPH|nr:hypothetical protein [Hoeflea prorocentri]MCY6383000.1 hypothetical protein [Hoeflea prorocentri]MDA5400800.1 hypothetical protein [Hoeflea prorocentri]
MTLHPAIAIALIPLSVMLLVVVMGIVRIAARRYGWSAEIQRKAVHVATGLYAMSLPWILPEPWMVYSLLVLAVIVMGVLRIPALAKGGIGSALHGVERSSWGDVMLVAAVGTLYFFSGNGSVAVLYLLPLAVLTLSDAAAAVAGSGYGRLVYTIEDGQKSIEGSLVFFMVTWILAMIALLLLSDVPRVSVVMLSVMIAAFGTVIEADSWRGFDNYFVPVGVLFLVAVHMDSGPVDLILLALGFLAVLCLLNVYGGALLGLSKHTARAYTAALFLIGAVTTLPNMILPASALLTQTYARRQYPGDARHPDLDMLAMLAVVSFGWLICGVALGHVAISFYGTTCGAMVALLGPLALAERPFWQRVSLTALLVLLLGVIVSGVIAINPADTRWHGNTVAIVVVSLVVPALAGLLRPGFFHHNRYAKAGVVSVFVPLVAYLYLLFTQESL